MADRIAPEDVRGWLDGAIKDLKDRIIPEQERNLYLNMGCAMGYEQLRTRLAELPPAEDEAPAEAFPEEQP